MLTVDKDGFTKWVKQCRDYAVEIGLMEDGCDLGLSAHGKYDAILGRDSAYTVLSKHQREVRIKFEDAPRNEAVHIPVNPVE